MKGVIKSKTYLQVVNDEEFYYWTLASLSSFSLLGHAASISLIISVYFSHSLVSFGSSIDIRNNADVIDPIPTTMQPSISKSSIES